MRKYFGSGSRNLSPNFINIIHPKGIPFAKIYVNKNNVVFLIRFNSLVKDQEKKIMACKIEITKKATVARG